MNNYDYNIERKPFPPFLLFPQANDISILIDESLEQTFHSYIHLSGLHLSCEMAQIAITSIVGQMLAKKAFQSITDMWRARQIREMGERIDAELAALKGGK